MKEFECPKCLTKVTARATEVGHRCPSNKNKWVAFKEVPNA